MDQVPFDEKSSQQNTGEEFIHEHDMSTYNIENENIHHSEYSCNVCYHLTIMLIKHQIDHHRSSSTSKRRKVLGFFENIEQRSIEFPETNQNYEILINVALRKVEYIADRTNDDISEQKTPYSKKHHQSDEPELIQVKLENNVASSSRTNIKQSAGTDKIKRAKKARPDVRQKKRKRLTCDVCERQFWNKVGILNHLQRKHFPVAKKQRSKASECILCETCGREYSSRKRLLTHLITHRNRRLHKCTMCDREFLDRGALREHVYAHTGERPFKCLYGCEQSFGHASNRRQHHRSFHQPEKQFTCPICAKTMTRKCGYLEHMRTHTGEQPYACEHCGKSFSSKKTLRNHRRIHTGERPYKCDRCDKAFIEHKALKIHMKRKTLCAPRKID